MLNNSIRSVGAYDLIEGQREIASEDGNQLLENRDGFFVPVSADKGVSSSAIGFGLGITLSDFNGDHWPDLFISNDYFEKDYLYINQDGRGFKVSSDSDFDALSIGSMGADAADLDNDLRPDIMVTEMLPETLTRQKSKQVFESWDKFQLAGEMGYHKQYSRNVLQRNLNNRFYEVGRQLGVSATEWSWASLLFDMDNDGYRDIYVSNGIFKDLLDRDYLTYNANEESLRQQMRQGEEAVTALIDLMPSSAVPNAVYRNKGDFSFENVRQLWGLDEISFSNGSAYGDLDNDGDLDVITNNIDAPAFVYENKTTGNFLKVKIKGEGNNTFGIGAKAKIYHNGKIQKAENTVTRGFISSVEHDLFFGLGKDTEIEKVEVIWPNGKVNIFENIKANRVIKADIADAEAMKLDSEKSNLFFKNIDVQDLGLDFTHKENEYDDWKEQVLLPHRLSQNGPFSATADINGDGLEDLFVGGAKDQSGVLYIQNSLGKFSKNSSQPWRTDKESEDLGCLFFDADGDSDLDLYVASGGNEFRQGDVALLDRLYINDGNGNFRKSISA